MSTIVVMPGGFHPFHAGHAALYNSARRAFPDAEVYVAATNDTSTRPFPFQIKEKLAKLAGVEPGHFVQVKSPFQAKEITAQYNPEKDVLIFVRSEKDASKPPQAGGNKKDGNPTYLQPLLGAKRLEPFAKHAYMAYLPTVEFGPGMTSATEIRAAWPHLTDKRRQALVMSLYPATQKNPALAANVVKMLDTAMGGDLDEGEVVAFPKKHRGDINNMHSCPKCGGDTHGGKYEGHEVQVCIPCKQVYLPPNSGIDQQGNKIKEAGFDREEFRRHMKDLEAREELRKTDPVAAKALDLRGQLPQQSKKKPEDDSISINDPRHPGYAYTQAGQHKLNEFAPDEGGGSRKFIPWPEFIEQVKQIVSKDFSCKENVVKSTIKARFVPHDPMEYGPTMLYSYYETRAGGRNKGAVSTRGSIQVGKYTKGGLFGQAPDQLLTGFHLLKGHPFERHFDLTFDNIYKIANIILGNTEGALEFKPEGVDENQGFAATFTNEMDAQNMVGGMTASYQQRENQPVNEDYLDEATGRE